MTQELDTRIKELCELIINEKNGLVFQDLVMELKLRLEERDKIRGITLVPKQSDQLLETVLPLIRERSACPGSLARDPDA
jgi:hypothetical protein